MKRSDCLVMISGEAPVRDKKYNLFDHPNLKYTPDHLPEEIRKAYENAHR
jgi:type IV secretory pathway TraG/TraD family ATPase VirD4